MDFDKFLRLDLDWNKILEAYYYANFERKVLVIPDYLRFGFHFIKKNECGLELGFKILNLEQFRTTWDFEMLNPDISGE